MKFYILGLAFLANIAHGAVVLQYHHVDSSTPSITSTSPEDFRTHLDYIAQNGLTVTSLSSIVQQPEIEDDNRVAITFDDAYANLLTNAIPELVARAWPFTIFVATQYVGQPGYLTWDDLREIERLGGTLANHTHSHLHMLRRSDNESDKRWRDRLTREITMAQNLLEKHLKRPSRHFAYPYGEYNLEILRLIEALDFVGFGQQSGAVGNFSDQRLLPRFPLSGIYADYETFKVKVHTRALPIIDPEVSPLATHNPPELTLSFPGAKVLRFGALVCYGPGGPTQLQRTDTREFTARSKTPLPIGRSRYNCTMPVAGSDQFYWYSQLWINKNPDGSWYPEP